MPTTKVTTASVVRELPSARSGGASALYRLVLTCNAETREGEVQLAWSPSPKTGSLTAVIDGKRKYTYSVEGKEKMGNGNPITTGPAAINLFETTKSANSPRMLLPEKSLRISDLFPNESVEFSFDDLPNAARQSLAACW